MCIIGSYMLYYILHIYIYIWANYNYWDDSSY